MKKIKVDEEKCIGCGACVASCPKTFKLNREGKAVVINPPGDSEDDIKNMIDSCPTQAISW